MLEDPKLYQELRRINSYRVLTQRIKTLEASNLSINEQLRILNLVLNDVKNDLSLLERVKQLISKNPDLNFMLNSTIDIPLEEDQIFVPLTTVPVERSFSALTYLLNDRRTNLKTDSLEKILFLYFNK
ncbi:hypothetical protein DMUE_5722 [Dictyocoela muelleri]|nr:hypothetical protein DMUE_5722 [Dictyocoela muelleri]